MIVTNEMIEVCLQPSQEKHIKISLLHNFFVNEGGKQVRKFRKVGDIQGNAIGGSVNIDANSAIRRTCSLDIAITDSSFLIGEDKKIWLDKWFELKVGIRHLITGRIVWFDKGVYAINSPTVNYDLSERTLSIEGLDPMATLDGTLGGELGIVTKLEAGTNLSEAVKMTVNSLGEISLSDIYIEHNDYVLPYDIEKTATDTVYSILEEIKQLYLDWEMYFDEENRFIYRKIKNRNVANPVPNYENDVITFNFLEDNDLVVDYNLDYLFSNVKNKVIVWGRQKDNGEQIHIELVNNDANSPFNVNKDFGTIVKTIVDDKIYEVEQAVERGNYEMYKHNNMCEELSITLWPLYFLSVNHLVEFNRPEIELSGKYLIDNIGLDLDIAGLMDLSSHKVYAIDN